MAEKIRWTIEEREALADAFALLRSEDPFSSVSELLRRAQEQIFSKERWRDTKTLTATDQKLKTLLSERYATIMTPSEPAHIIVREPEKSEPIDIQILLQDIPLEELLIVAIRRYFSESSSRSQAPLGLANKITEKLSQRRYELNEVKTISAAKKMRVTVVGFGGRDAQAIQGKVPNDISLTFIDKHKNPRPIQSTADYVLVHRSSHGWSQKVDAHTSGNRVIFITGGINSIVAKIIELRSIWLARDAHPKRQLVGG